MKIQDLAIIFLIIIIPISIVLSAYTQFQIGTLELQTQYDAKLTSATYDAIKAFQLNTTNSSISDISNSKIRDIEASVATFRNSIMSAFGLNGYTEEELNSYIPALVYTMYDGFYIYSPYENVNYLYDRYKRDANGNIERDSYGNPKYVDGQGTPIDNNGETLYGLKPYITYSCRYVKDKIDVVITYTLDNFITIQGTIDGGQNYINKEGYLIDGITVNNDSSITYNGVEIKAEENLKEFVLKDEYPYIKLNGTKYYYDGSTGETFYILNGKKATQGGVDYSGRINNNDSAIQYYAKADEFTKWVRDNGLIDLKYKDAELYKLVEKGKGNYEIDENGKYQDVGQGNGNYIKQYENDGTKIFDGNTNIENDLSNFNQHRLEVIRNTIENNLSIVIANYNKYSKATGIEFQMPELKEDEWDKIIDNISLISFVQGLYIGGKIYNGYTIINNTESKEVVQEENIYILGNDNFYHRIGDNYFKDESTVAGVSAGRLNLDFKRQVLTNTTDSITKYYYPLKGYNASYNSIVTQNDVTVYDDIYKFINEHSNTTLKKAFYTALGREREGTYKPLRTSID